MNYVMSDIHGCIDDVKRMLELIKFSDEDTLIFAGDYIDRGPKNLKTLEWIKANKSKDNIIFLMGNHDIDFIDHVENMVKARESIENKTGSFCNDLSEIMFEAHLRDRYWNHFDHYHTIRDLVFNDNVTLKQLIEYKDVFKTFDYVHQTIINDKHFIIVHAGYIEEKDFVPNPIHQTIKDYYVWVREDGYTKASGIQDSIIIAGHTPTVIPGEFSYTGGVIYKQYNESNNCTLYDIDCGCTYAYGGYTDSYMCKLACIRLEDEQVFYITPNI